MLGGMVRKFYLLLLIFFCGTLIGCMSVATSGAQAIYNHHSIQKSVNDQLITIHAYRSLREHPETTKQSNISIATYDSEVLVSGQVASIGQKQRIDSLMKGIPNTTRVHNLLTVEGKSSTLTRISDAWLTAKIKSKMIASNDVDATLVKVVTENGTVYLMGTLKPEQAEAAVELASNTDGVQSVVKIFSYIHITKNSQL